MTTERNPYKSKSKVPYTGTSVQKLQFFYNLAVEQFNKLFFVLNNSARYRGDTLELFIDNGKGSITDSSHESRFYVKTGILITFLYQIIESYGYKPVIRTFPRFDEQNLVAFVFLGSRHNISSETNEEYTLATIPENKIPAPIDNPMQDTFSRKAHNHAMSYYAIQNQHERDQIVDFLCSDQDLRIRKNGGQNPTVNSSENFNSKILKRLKDEPLPNDLLLIGSEQNNLSSWLKTGLFVGDIMLKALSGNHLIYPVNMNVIAPDSIKAKPELCDFDFNHHHLILYSAKLS